MADEGPSKGWAGTHLQGSFTGDGDHVSCSWARFKDSGKGKQESLDHREARSRKKHSAKLGQKPFPSCVKTPGRLGRRPEEVPCPWTQGSGSPGMFCSSSPLHRGLMGSLEGKLATNPRVLRSSSSTRASSHQWKADGIVQGPASCPIHELGPERGQGEKLHFMTNTWSIPRLSTVEVGAITINS